MCTPENAKRPPASDALRAEAVAVVDAGSRRRNSRAPLFQRACDQGVDGRATIERDANCVMRLVIAQHALAITEPVGGVNYRGPE
jgi:hypothetical protein